MQRLREQLRQTESDRDSAVQAMRQAQAMAKAANAKLQEAKEREYRCRDNLDAALKQAQHFKKEVDAMMRGQHDHDGIIAELRKENAQLVHESQA